MISRYMNSSVSALLLLVSPAALSLEEHSISLSVDSVELHATLVQPDGSDVLVILHPGSGPTDRDGNQPGMQNDGLHLLSDGLAAAGLAVLRYDKRGVGASQSDQRESELRPSHYINDLVAWADWARATGTFSRLVLLGHSEGAMFAKAAAGLTEVDGVVSVAGAGRRMGVLLLEQTEGRRPGALDKQFREILASLEAGREVEDVPPLLAALFRPSVQPYLIEWLALDPAELAGQLNVPLLVVAGSTDLQVVRVDYDALAEHADQSVWIEGMNHVLREKDGTLAEQMSSYLSPEAPLHAELVPVVVNFIKGISR